MSAPIILGGQVRAELLAHAAAEQPLEACGLVGGRGGCGERFYPTRNALRSAVRYDVEPRDLLAVTMELEVEGLELWGIFHSHPATEAYPSPTDVRLAHYPDAFYLICSLREPGRPVLRAFRIVGGAITEVAIAESSK